MTADCRGPRRNSAVPLAGVPVLISSLVFSSRSLISIAMVVAKHMIGLLTIRHFFEEDHSIVSSENLISVAKCCP